MLYIAFSLIFPLVSDNECEKLSGRAWGYILQGHYEKAEKLLFLCHTRYLIRGGDDYADSCSEIGAMYLFWQKYQKAEIFFEKGIRWATKDETKRRIALNWSTLCTSIGKYKKAALLLKDCIRFSGGKENWKIQHNFAILYQECGENKKAVNVLTEIIRGFRKNKELDVSLYLSLLLKVEIAAGNLEDAEKTLKENGILCREYRHQERAERDQALFCLASGKTAQAEVHIRNVLRITENSKRTFPYYYSQDLELLGKILKAFGKTKEAEAAFSECIRVRENTVSKHPSLAKVFLEWASLQKDLKKRREMEILAKDILENHRQVEAKEIKPLP